MTTTSKSLPLSDADVIERKRIEDEIKRARRAREARESAPISNVRGAHLVEQKRLIRLYAPDCVPKREERDGRMVRVQPENHAAFFPAKQRTNLVANGYEPVINDVGDVVTSENGDVCMKTSTKLYNRQREAELARARFLVTDVEQATKEHPEQVSEEITM